MSSNTKLYFKHQKHNTMIVHLNVNDLSLCLHREYLIKNVSFKKLFENNYRKLHIFLSFVDTNLIKIISDLTTGYFFPTYVILNEIYRKKNYSDEYFIHVFIRHWLQT